MSNELARRLSAVMILPSSGRCVNTCCLFVLAGTIAKYLYRFFTFWMKTQQDSLSVYDNCHGANVTCMVPAENSHLITGSVAAEMHQEAWRHHLKWLSDSLKRLTEEEEEEDSGGSTSSCLK